MISGLLKDQSYQICEEGMRRWRRRRNEDLARRR
jgi:hypothetical protein